MKTKVTHTIFTHSGPLMSFRVVSLRLFIQLFIQQSNTIIGSHNVIEGSGRVIILFSRGTKFIINNTLLSTKSLGTC